MRRSVVLTFAAALTAMILAAPAASWTWPADGQVIRAFSLGDDPYAGGQHRGIDIAADSGSGVRAPAAGTVSFAGTVPGNGRTVTIRTGDGYAVTLVGLGSIGVKKNAFVSEGETVGTVAPAPDEITPANVHLGIRIASDPNGYLDPITLLPARTEKPIVSDQAGDEATPTALDESVPTMGDEAQSSSEPEATAATDNSGLDGAETVGVAVGAIAEVAPTAPSSGDESVIAGENGAEPTEGQAEGTGEESAVASPVEPSSESTTSALANVPSSTAAAVTRSQATIDVSTAVPTQREAELPRSSSAPVKESSSPGGEAATSRNTQTRRSTVKETSTAATASATQLKQRKNVGARNSEPASPGTHPQVGTHSHSLDSHWILLPGLLLLLFGATGGSVLAAARSRGSRRPPRMMVSPEGETRDDERERATEDPGCGGLAVCQRPAPYWARRRVRRPVRHLRPLSPAQGQRRADGEWHRRARYARDGRGRARRALVS